MWQYFNCRLAYCVKHSSWTDHSQSGPSSSARRTSSCCRSPSISSHGLSSSSSFCRSYCEYDIRHDICLVPFHENSSLKHLECHALTRDHTVTCHPRISPQREWAILPLLPYCREAEIARWRHRGRSLPSPTVSCFLQKQWVIRFARHLATFEIVTALLHITECLQLLEILWSLTGPPVNCSLVNDNRCIL